MFWRVQRLWTEWEQHIQDQSSELRLPSPGEMEIPQSLCNSSTKCWWSQKKTSTAQNMKLPKRTTVFPHSLINDQKNWTASGDPQAARAAGIKNQADVQKKKPRAPCRAGKFLQNFQRTHSWLHWSWTNRFRNIPFYWFSIKDFNCLFLHPFSIKVVII